jgi:hypothetical protein
VRNSGFCEVLLQTEQFNFKCEDSRDNPSIIEIQLFNEVTPEETLEKIIEKIPTLNETIKPNSTDFLEEVCLVEQRLEERLSNFQRLKIRFG